VRLLDRLAGDAMARPESPHEERTDVHRNGKDSPAGSMRKAPLPPGDDVGAADLARKVGVQLREQRKARGPRLDISSNPSRRAKVISSKTDSSLLC
jgi:hypothetical protein